MLIDFDENSSDVEVNWWLMAPLIMGAFVVVLFASVAVLWLMAKLGLWPLDRC